MHFVGERRTIKLHKQANWWDPCCAAVLPCHGMHSTSMVTNRLGNWAGTEWCLLHALLCPPTGAWSALRSLPCSGPEGLSKQACAPPPPPPPHAAPQLLCHINRQWPSTIGALIGSFLLGISLEHSLEALFQQHSGTARERDD